MYVIFLHSLQKILLSVPRAHLHIAMGNQTFYCSNLAVHCSIKLKFDVKLIRMSVNVFKTKDYKCEIGEFFNFLPIT